MKRTGVGNENRGKGGSGFNGKKKQKGGELACGNIEADLTKVQLFGGGSRGGLTYLNNS